MQEKINQLASSLQGSIHTDTLHTTIYATDASVYKNTPIAVAYPKNTADIQKIVRFAAQHNIGLIPRTAGTSLAGQCVGKGMVVDVSRYLTKIITVDTKAKTVTLEPGVIRDELNAYLKPLGLFFGPNTSTSNRCMIGGMVGNNSSGSTSIRYGVTRDKVLAIETVLSDGSIAHFKELSQEQYQDKKKQNTLEGKIYRDMEALLAPDQVQKEIQKEFPKPEIHRRNTGYAVDVLLTQQPYNPQGKGGNLCALLAGSEGTLAFTTQITLQLEDLPPQKAAMLAVHFTSIADCLKAVVPVMKHHLYTCEMMDKVILDCTKNNRLQQKNRFFIEKDPEAILLLELRAHTDNDLETAKQALLQTLHTQNLGYAAPCLYAEDIKKALELRKAGLGLLGNMVGDKKAVACIEDTAVSVTDLADYIQEFTALMQKYDQKAVYYAHAGAGELHLRPILDLKKATDVSLFRAITTDVAHLVKKYQGSFSGEHGDGMVRAEFIPMLIGPKNYHLLKQVKHIFDAKSIFNPGKITDAPLMDTNLRYTPDREEPNIDTFLDFSDSLGILRATEKCNGSGDCRKTHLSTGTMCPSYQATKQEKDTTRARANALRNFLTDSNQQNKFNHIELKQVLDLCLSCKACATECPSNVDMASLKSEFLYQYQKENGSSLRDKAFAYATTMNKMAAQFPKLSNWFFSNTLTSGIIKKGLGIAKERDLPLVSPITLKKIIADKKTTTTKKVVLFIDEFTQFLEGTLAKDAYTVLQALGYSVEVLFLESGRSFMSKGFLPQAKKCADTTISVLSQEQYQNLPVLGIEPSAVSMLKEDYLRIATHKQKARSISENTFFIEEFLAREITQNNITKTVFTTAKKQVKVHVHCHQKSLTNTKDTFDVLNAIPNYTVTLINSGCCGMAGSFGYEKEHYKVSMQAGALRLFPAVKKAEKDTIIAANGTSCRHQIKDGTAKKALHPITVLRQALV